MDLKDGDYTINMRANGQAVQAPSEFKVTRDTN